MLNRCTGLNLYPGFESLPHRQFSARVLLIVFDPGCPSPPCLPEFVSRRSSCPPCWNTRSGTAQFGVGRSMWSMINVSTGSLAGSSLRPNRSRTAVKTDASDGSTGAHGSRPDQFLAIAYRPVKPVLSIIGRSTRRRKSTMSCGIDMHMVGPAAVLKTAGTSGL